MLHEFKNLSDESKREFVLKYYPLILRSQQKKERLSKEEFLRRYLQVKRGEHAGKLLISKTAYKRYLRLIKYMGISRYDYIDDVIENEDGSYSISLGDYPMFDVVEPHFSELDIPNIHQKKYGIDIPKHIIEKFDDDVLEEIWSIVSRNTLSDRFLKDRQLYLSGIGQEILKSLAELNLTELLYATLNNLRIDEGGKKEYHIERYELVKRMVSELNRLAKAEYDKAIKLEEIAEKL
jgi:hypothetical protein